MQNLKIMSALYLMIFLAFSCEKDSTDDGTNPTTETEEPNNTELPENYQNFYNVEDIYRDGDFVVIETKGVPDHTSPYFAQSDSRYEAYNGNNPNFRLNPNSIQEQSLTFRIPANPQAAANKRATALGPIGVSINGVAIFNQYAGPDQPLTNEINSFDQHLGHPTGGGQYHYHIEPLFLTLKYGKESLVGFLLDGFPVYGPLENGSTISNADLDSYHGHFGNTAEYPDGIYHYHITDEDPYINGNGYFGTPGNVTR